MGSLPEISDAPELARLRRLLQTTTLSLHNEVEKRQGVLKNLEGVRGNLIRTEGDRLVIKDRAQHLQSENAVYQELAEKLTRQLEEALRGRDEAVEQARLQKERSSERARKLGLELAKVQQAYESDEIVIVSLRDQVARLEQEQQSMRLYRREQSSKLGGVQQLITNLELAKSQVTQRLEILEAEHNRTGKVLDQVQRERDRLQAEMVEKDKRWDEHRQELQVTISRTEAERDMFKEQCQGLVKELQDLRLDLEKVTIKGRENDQEVTLLRDAALVMSKTLDQQGVQGVPPHTDKVWQMVGVRGGLYRLMELAHGHLQAQQRHYHDALHEIADLKQQVEMAGQQRGTLQQELMETRLICARIAKEKEATDQKLDYSEEQRKVMEMSLTRCKEQVTADGLRLKELQDEVLKLTKQVTYLTPFEPRCCALEEERDSLLLRVERMEEDLVSVRQDQKQQVAHHEEHREQLQVVKEECKRLEEEKTAVVAKAETLAQVVTDLTVHKQDLQQSLSTTTQQLAVTKDKYASALKQLELAKMFLKGTSESSAGSLTGSRPGSAGQWRSRMSGSSSGDHSVPHGPSRVMVKLSWAEARKSSHHVVATACKTVPPVMFLLSYLLKSGT